MKNNMVECKHTGIFGPFVVFGLFGFLWVLVWIPAISGTPGEHAQISAYELKYITKGQKLVKPQIGSEKTKKVPLSLNCFPNGQHGL
jgi:hypothetical protein